MWHKPNNYEESNDQTR